MLAYLVVCAPCSIPLIWLIGSPYMMLVRSMPFCLTSVSLFSSPSLSSSYGWALELLDDSCRALCCFFEPLLRRAVDFLYTVSDCTVIVLIAVHVLEVSVCKLLCLLVCLRTHALIPFVAIE